MSSLAASLLSFLLLLAIARVGSEEMAPVGWMLQADRLRLHGNEEKHWGDVGGQLQLSDKEGQNHQGRHRGRPWRRFLENHSYPEPSMSGCSGGWAGFQPRELRAAMPDPSFHRTCAKSRAGW